MKARSGPCLVLISRQLEGEQNPLQCSQSGVPQRGRVEVGGGMAGSNERNHLYPALVTLKAYFVILMGDNTPEIMLFWRRPVDKIQSTVVSK